MTKARNIAELANDISVDNNRDVTLSNLRSDQPMMFRNRIINGDMRISQRNSSNQVTPPTNGDTIQTNNYPVDRWFIQNSSGSATIFGQQVTDVPNGNFQHSVKISTTTAINTTQAQQLNFQQRIEGYNVADFGFGSTSAKSMTFSFYVKSNVLGNYGFIIHNGNVCFVSKYEITTEDVWKKVTINLTPQTSYALSNSTNGTGLYINFDLGCGSDFESNNEGWQTGDLKRPINCIKWANNTNATLYITGVQLEEGTVATPFEHRPYEMELSLCKRYFQEKILSSRTFGGSQSNHIKWRFDFEHVMRSAPDLIVNATYVGSYAPSGNDLTVWGIGASSVVLPSLLAVSGNKQSFVLYLSVANSGTGNIYELGCSDGPTATNPPSVLATAEL